MANRYYWPAITTPITPAPVGKEAPSQPPVTEEHFEIPHFATAVEAVLRVKRSNVQDTLEALANEGYWLVRRRQPK